jgi:hypothetical protein
MPQYPFVRTSSLKFLSKKEKEKKCLLGQTNHVILAHYVRTPTTYCSCIFLRPQPAQKREKEKKKEATDQGPGR